MNDGSRVCAFERTESDAQSLCKQAYHLKPEPLTYIEIFQGSKFNFVIISVLGGSGNVRALFYF